MIVSMYTSTEEYIALTYVYNYVSSNKAKTVSS